MTRREHIDRILKNVAGRGECGEVLSEIIALEIDMEETQPNPMDPRKVAIAIMKNMRAAMTEIRQELDALDDI